MWFCSLFSGSSGNCLYVGTQKTNILIDAGLSGKKIISSLNEIGISPKSINALLITHEHIDHVRGAGVLSRMFNIPVYANNNTWGAMENLIGRVNDDNIKVIDGDEPFAINDIEIKSFKTPHDAADPVGYCLFNGGKKISIATDIGHVSDIVFSNIKDSDLIMLESNHDVEMLKFGPYPYILKRRILSDIGHLSNSDAGNAIVKLIGNKYMNIILGHLSEQNNFPELAYQTVLSILAENCINVGEDVKIDLANRSSVSNFFELK